MFELCGKSYFFLILLLCWDKQVSQMDQGQGHFIVDKTWSNSRAIRELGHFCFNCLCTLRIVGKIYSKQKDKLTLASPCHSVPYTPEPRFANRHIRRKGLPSLESRILGHMPQPPSGILSARGGERTVRNRSDFALTWRTRQDPRNPSLP